MAAVTVDTAIRPEETTCCLGYGLVPIGDDRWGCPRCGCELRAELSAFVPRGWRLVIEVVTATCRLHHD